MELLERISTGSFDFNEFLGGGYEKDVITMLAGPPGSGKTNLAILAACSQANSGKKILFVDSEGGFSLERVKQIVGSENYEKILENIFLIEPVSFEEQTESFSKMLKKIKSGNFSLIVIDGMSMLYRLELGEAIKNNKSKEIGDINREMAFQMKFLSEISRKQKIPVLITNQVYSLFHEGEIKNNFEKEANIVGGDTLKYWSKCIIELRKDNNKRKAVLIKHRSMPQKEFSFEIRDKGIFKKGWI